ncbi:hypothetical protein GIB67_026155 [Kingdonia uniflora]|uniref:Protein kinase domain-containing protein n=1 Tax=Kingdonia uniflora TaxID=39325 RepID=A0A7J7M339_9MAGN|nr:hypothetical protein GIB67_026155 [Kingdonia uniflora]
MRLNLYLCCLHLFIITTSFLLLLQGVTSNEVRSLLEFKKGIRVDPLGHVLESWNQSTLLGSVEGCPSSWYGVVCDEESGLVIAVVLEGLGLVGDLKFSTLIGLKMLQNLSLSGNSLSGRFVPALGAMTSLRHLDLSRNEFYGPIPAKISDLWDLHYLNLSMNDFSGGFPTKIGNLQQLKWFDLHSNRLSGDVGELFPELRNVEYVDLSYNRFYGGLSLELDKISGLANTIHYLNLSHNRLNGDFFSDDSIKLFRNLVVLDLGDNQLTGELPLFDALPSLRVLRAGNNQLYGSMPEELFQSSVRLEELDFSGNGFSGSIPTINSTTLKVLNLSLNVLSGSLPSTLGEGCVTVDLSGNLFSGEISIMQSWGDTLEVVDLSSNALSGSLPNLTSQYSKLISFKVRNNSLAGSLPFALDSSPRLSSVDLSSNELTGSILSSFFTSMTLVSLNLSGNHFTGIIPFQTSQTNELLVLPSSPVIESIDLSDNSLSGSLPSEIGNLGMLKLLNLRKNSLSGQIPSEMSKLSGLEYLDLSVNNFKGKIPERLSLSLNVFNVSYNDFSGPVPENLRKFPYSSFHPGNTLLIIPPGMAPSDSGGSGGISDRGQRHSSKSSIRVAIIVASIGAALMIIFVLFAYYQAHHHKFHGSQTVGRDVQAGRFLRPSFFTFQKGTDQPPPSSLSFSNDHLLTSNSRSLSGSKDLVTATVDRDFPEGRVAADMSESPISSSPRFLEASEQPVMLNVYSPDRLAGELFFLDSSLVFTAEELSRAPAEVLGRSSHGTLYKATLDSGHMLTVKWLRVGLVKHKKEFAKEAKRIGSIRHPNMVSLRAYYWGPREQERLILADYVIGDSLALHLYETTPRRYSRLSFIQRLKISVDVARSLCHLHDRGLPHGNLKPTNILLRGPDLTACLTDYGLHRLMTPSGTAEQILNLGALGYGAPEFVTASKPMPSLKADVYAFGVILMELLTRKSAGDIISGQSGAVDLTDWVRLCANDGRGLDCFDRDISDGEEHPKAMDDLLSASLKCILPVNERPSIRTVFEDLCSLSL